MRTYYEGNQLFFKFKAVVVVKKCLERVELQILLRTCALFDTLSSYKGSMNLPDDIPSGKLLFTYFPTISSLFFFLSC